MRYALLSDVHGRRRRLERVLADARARRAERFISLGDVGGDDCLALLRQAGARGVFGNYEVSGWRRLAEVNRSWVCSWPPMLVEDRFLAVHAVPWHPSGLKTVKDFSQWLRLTGSSWRTLFPYLTEDDDHLWRTAAELETLDRSVLFHGHTHRQEAWRFAPSSGMKRIHSPVIDVDRFHRYVVGVGSVGYPEDGGWAAYALYDSDAARIHLVRLGPHRSDPE